MKTIQVQVELQSGTVIIRPAMKVPDNYKLGQPLAEYHRKGIKAILVTERKSQKGKSNERIKQDFIEGD